MNWAIFEITDGTNSISLLEFFRLLRWEPKTAEAKGGGVWSDSPSQDGRRLVDRYYDNVIETLELGIPAGNMDKIAERLQALQALLVAATDYWTNSANYTPVYLHVRGGGESNDRYALLYDWSIDEMNNPFRSPIFKRGENWAQFSLIVERGDWMSNVPGTGTQVALINNETGFNGRTYGLSTATTDKVFWANKYARANLTHVFYYWDAMGLWGANMITGGVPAPLLPSAVLVGDILYCGCETAVIDSGPFSSVIFDLDPGRTNNDYVGQWEYWTGAAWVVIATVMPFLDTTVVINSFEYAGVRGIFFTPPANWAANAVNGVTAFWVRFRVTASGGTNQGPQQLNRIPYAVTWPYIEVEADQVGGDLEARIALKSRSKGVARLTPVIDTTADRFIIGRRAVSRGENYYRAYLNLADVQNPSGIVVSTDIAATTSFVDRTYAAAGRAIEWAPVGAVAMAIRCYVTLEQTIVDEFQGVFRMFLRVREEVGAGDIFSFRVRISNSTSGTYGIVWVSDTIVMGTGNGNGSQAIDFGVVTFPPAAGIKPADMSEFYIMVDAASTGAGTIVLYDLVLIPIDEWACELIQISADPDGESYYPIDWRFDSCVDALTNPKYLLGIADLTDTGPPYAYDASTFDYRAIWLAYQTHTSDIPKLQPGERVRYWMLALNKDAFNVTLPRDSNPAVTQAASLWASERWLSLRGSS